MFGLMLTSTHKAAMAEAVADLEQADREINRLTRGWETADKNNQLLRRQLDDSEAELADLRPDALKRRDSLKRSRDRRAAKKNAPARDKRAKNRGGK